MLKKHQKHTKSKVLGYLLALGILFCGYARAKTGAPDIVIYVDHTAVAAIADSTDLVSGRAMNKLIRVLELSGLEYEINYLPWARALRSVNDNPRGLIYQLLRTKKREENYHWLMPVSSSEEIALYSSSALVADDVINDIRLGKFTAACHLQSAQCSMLEQIGFPKDSVVEIASQSLFAEENLLLQERVDFILAFPSVIKHNIMLLNEDASKVKMHKSFAMSADYLAASKQIDPELLKALQNAVKLVDEAHTKAP